MTGQEVWEKYLDWSKVDIVVPCWRTPVFNLPYTTSPIAIDRCSMGHTEMDIINFVDNIYPLIGAKHDISLEIGMLWGATHIIWKQLFNEVFSIEINTDMCAAFAGHNDLTNSHIIYADSQTPLAVNAVRNALNDRQVDFLYIDGDHSYEGVKNDFLNFEPFVRNGGLIGFHDTQICPGVVLFIEQLKLGAFKQSSINFIEFNSGLGQAFYIKNTNSEDI